jgi:hypothetical protein
MAAGTVISGGFPGRVAQEVQPNQKCHGCLHYDGQAGRTGACTIGLRPWLCGEGEAAEIGYAPITHGAGSYLPDMNTHGSHAAEVESQDVSSLYGAGSTRPVMIQQVSLGEEHVQLVKSMVANHTKMQKSMCRLCHQAGTIGISRSNADPQVCTCEPIAARDIAKSIYSRLSNRAQQAVTPDDVEQFVYDVAKSGFKMPKNFVTEAQELETLEKSIYDGDWIHQFKGTPLFDAAMAVCETEIAHAEEDLKARKERRKKQQQAPRAEPDNDWEARQHRSEKIGLAKQKLQLKLAKHHQSQMAKGGAGDYWKQRKARDAAKPKRSSVGASTGHEHAAHLMHNGYVHVHHRASGLTGLYHTNGTHVGGDYRNAPKHVIDTAVAAGPKER